MTEDISVQILTQASDNIQKLFDLSIRIDERVKLIQSRQEQMDKRIDDTLENYIAITQKIAVLEAGEKVDEMMANKMHVIEATLTSLDKRVTAVEKDHGKRSDRWNKIVTFVINLVWVLIAAYLLMKFGLQSPNIP